MVLPPHLVCSSDESADVGCKLLLVSALPVTVQELPAQYTHVPTINRPCLPVTADIQGKIIVVFPAMHFPLGLPPMGMPLLTDYEFKNGCIQYVYLLCMAA